MSTLLGTIQAPSPVARRAFAAARTMCTSQSKDTGELQREIVSKHAHYSGDAAQKHQESMHILLISMKGLSLKAVDTSGKPLRGKALAAHLEKMEERLQDWEKAMLPLVENLQWIQYMSVIQSYGYLRKKPRADLLDALERHGIVTIPRCKGFSISNVVWGFAKMPHLPSKELMALILHQVVKNSPELSAFDVARTIWSLGRLWDIVPADKMLEMGEDWLRKVPCISPPWHRSRRLRLH